MNKKVIETLYSIIKSVLRFFIYIVVFIFIFWFSVIIVRNTIEKLTSSVLILNLVSIITAFIVDPILTALLGSRIIKYLKLE